MVKDGNIADRSLNSVFSCIITTKVSLFFLLVDIAQMLHTIKTIYANFGRCCTHGDQRPILRSQDTVDEIGLWVRQVCQESVIDFEDDKVGCVHCRSV